MGSKKIIFFLVFLFVVQGVRAQGKTTIKASVDKTKILIGEPIQLTVEVTLPPGAATRFVTIDSIAHFEFAGQPQVDTAKTNSGTAIKGVFTITSFDSGHWVIPAFVLSPSVRSDTIPVDVVFSDFDPGQDYHDIKDILEVNPSKKKTPWWWYAAGGALLLALLLFYLLRKKKPRTAAAPEPLVSPFEEAMKQLEQLEKERPVAKQYHSKLTDIFRLYIFRKKGILSLQKTTDDLVVQLRDLELDKEQFEKLSQSLRLSDFVKFAKYAPASEDNRTCFNEISNAIITIEKSAPGSPSFGGS
ncbi:MAG: LPXTG cell wall anchor domain-containing protein [Ferruginibacter sp.]|nr:LPXTG cell wall anchor domain-containing protein [Chitinophagaceae bacterium]